MIKGFEKKKKKNETVNNNRRNRELTESMVLILLKDRSNQPRLDGWARKCLSMYWRPENPVMQLLLRRKERLRCFPCEFVFRGRKPIWGFFDNASEPEMKQIQEGKYTVSETWMNICCYTVSIFLKSIKQFTATVSTFIGLHAVQLLGLCLSFEDTDCIYEQVP